MSLDLHTHCTLQPFIPNIIILYDYDHHNRWINVVLLLIKFQTLLRFHSDPFVIYNPKKDSAFHIYRFPASSRGEYMCAVWTVHIHGLWIPAMTQGQSGFTSHWLSFTVPKVTHLVWEFCSPKESFGRWALRVLGILYSHHWFTVPFNAFPRWSSFWEIIAPVLCSAGSVHPSFQSSAHLRFC